MIILRIKSLTLFCSSCFQDWRKLILFLWLQKEAIDKGANAGAVISEIAKQLGGGGGGKPDSAQAGGKKPEKNRGSYEKCF